MATGHALRVVRVPGLLPYAAGLALQLETRAAVAQGAPATLLLVEHPPVFTVGKRCTTHNLRASEETLRSLGAELHVTDRGGDITFHGPGQLVGYPVVNLRALGCGVRDYVEGLEDCLVASAAALGVAARGRLPGAPGVWVGERKLAAVGVRVSGGVTSHGFALNVSTDLSFFAHIVPCGLPDKSVISLAQETGSAQSLDQVAPLVAAAFARHFGFAASQAHNLE